MRHIQSKYLVESKLSENNSLNTISSDFEVDDDDPLSFRSMSITILGIIIAFLTILLPSIGVLIGRPLSQGHEIMNNYTIKKDGS